MDKGEGGLDPARWLVLMKFVNNDAADIDAEATQYVQSLTARNV